MVTRAFFAITSILILSGCSTIFEARSQKKEIMACYQSGNFAETAVLAEKKADDRKNTGDELMWRLEEGSAFFSAGDYEKSIEAFEIAEDIILDYEKRAVVNLREGKDETASMLTNPNAIPYKGNYYEKIMLNAYKALCYFALGKPEDARVELRRMYERQKEAMARFESDIDEARKLAENNKSSMQDISTKVTEFKKIEKSVEPVSNKALGNFANPFATYLSAIGYLSDGSYDSAAVDFRTLYKMDPANTLFKKDLVTCSMRSSENIPHELALLLPDKYSLTSNIVYVIFANGMAAARKGITIHLVLPPPVTGYTGVSFPVLEYYPSPYECVSVKDTVGNVYRSVKIADMDSIIAREYMNALPAMITRIFLAVAVKEVANYFILKSLEGDSAAYWAAVVVMSAYKYAFNTPDTRCWQMLPKEYQIVHFPRPHDGKITIAPGFQGIMPHLSSDDVANAKEITFNNDKKISIIYVNSPSKGVFSVSLFEFN